MKKKPSLFRGVREVSKANGVLANFVVERNFILTKFVLTKMCFGKINSNNNGIEFVLFCIKFAFKGPMIINIWAPNKMILSIAIKNCDTQHSSKWHSA
jgi:hypothetical protein